MGQFDGKTAVVTGGNAGIGFATAKRLAAEGAHVFITGRRADELERAATEIGEAATAVPGDISVPADVDRLYHRVHERGQGIDILFANAGVNALVPMAELTEEMHDSIFDINVKGTFFTVQKALPHLNRGASVVLTGSTAGDGGSAGMSAYGASKAAVRAYARAWAAELSPRGVRVNVVSPGPVDTPLWDTAFGDRRDEMIAGVAAGIPAGRPGVPEEIAAAVVFLASSESSFVYGANLFVDGGLIELR